MNDSNRINRSTSIGPFRPGHQSRLVGDAPSFSDALSRAQKLKFSNHAQKRLATRNINLDDQSLNRLSEAIDKVGQRGGKESLVLMDDLAFIVNVRDRMVVTAIDSVNRGEGVFTQIDSVVLADKVSGG